MNTTRIPLKMRLGKNESIRFEKDPDTLLCETLKNLDQARKLLAKIPYANTDKFSRIPYDIWKRELSSLERRLDAYEVPEVLKDACCKNDTPNPRTLLERSQRILTELNNHATQKHQEV